MRSNTMRVALGIAAIALAVVLLIVLENDGEEGGGSGSSTSTSINSGSGSDGSGNSSSSGDGDSAGAGGAAIAVPTVVVRNGKPVGGPRTLTYIKGDQIRFQVDSDVSDEVHIHGYDISEDVEAGGSVRFDFRADLEGIFEVELEGAKRQIAELRVSP